MIIQASTIEGTTFITGAISALVCIFIFLSLSIGLIKEGWGLSFGRKQNRREIVIIHGLIIIIFLSIGFSSVYIYKNRNQLCNFFIAAEDILTTTELDVKRSAESGDWESQLQHAETILKKYQNYSGNKLNGLETARKLRLEAASQWMAGVVHPKLEQAELMVEAMNEKDRNYSDKRDFELEFNLIKKINALALKDDSAAIAYMANLLAFPNGVIHTNSADATSYIRRFFELGYKDKSGKLFGKLGSGFLVDTNWIKVSDHRYGEEKKSLYINTYSIIQSGDDTQFWSAYDSLYKESIYHYDDNGKKITEGKFDLMSDRMSWIANCKKKSMSSTTMMTVSVESQNQPLSAGSISSYESSDEDVPSDSLTRTDNSWGSLFNYVCQTQKQKATDLRSVVLQRV